MIGEFGEIVGAKKLNFKTLEFLRILQCNQVQKCLNFQGESIWLKITQIHEYPGISHPMLCICPFLLPFLNFTWKASLETIGRDIYLQYSMEFFRETIQWGYESYKMKWKRAVI